MFPNYKKGWLFDSKDGWKDLGLIEWREYDKESNRNMVYNHYCRTCRSKAHVGKDEEGTFRYCTKCLIKLKPL